jgi:putative ABC transport system substrate-binding protein
VLPHALTVFNASAIIALARRYRMPDVYALAELAAAGGLVSYGLDWDDQFRRVTEYVDQILRGVKPADLPVQAPTKYQLVINLKTAKALGLAIPERLIATADKVVE